MSRPALIERLESGIDRKLTIISAPAGYGKTSLAAEWIAQMAAAENAGAGTSPGIAWLSLDTEDDVLDRFVMYLVGALEHALGGRHPIVSGQ